MHAREKGNTCIGKYIEDIEKSREIRYASKEFEKSIGQNIARYQLH